MGAELPGQVKLLYVDSVGFLGGVEEGNIGIDCIFAIELKRCLSTCIYDFQCK